MPKCLKCNTEISYLHEYDKAEICYKFRLNIHGQPSWSEATHIDNDEVDNYECPECRQYLFSLEADAVAFLKGELAKVASEPEAYYCVVRLCREEIASMLPEDVRERVMEKTTELDLQHIAERVGNALVETDHWETFTEAVRAYFVETKRLKLSPTAAKPYVNYAVVE